MFFCEAEHFDGEQHCGGAGLYQCAGCLVMEKEIEPMRWSLDTNVYTEHTHGPKTWPWWRLVHVHIVRCTHDPAHLFWMPPIAYNIWLYTRWGARCLTYRHRRGVYAKERDAEEEELLHNGGFAARAGGAGGTTCTSGPRRSGEPVSAAHPPGSWFTWGASKAGRTTLPGGTGWPF